MEGRPTTMMPLQKLEKSCRTINWVMTIMARFLERSGSALVGGSTSGDADLSSDGVEMGRIVLIVPESESSVWSSRVVVVAISEIDGEVQDLSEAESMD